MSALDKLNILQEDYDFTRIYMIQEDQTHIVSLCDTFLSLTGNCKLWWNLFGLYFPKNEDNYYEANQVDSSYKEEGVPLKESPEHLQFSREVEINNIHLRSSLQISKIYIGFLNIPELVLIAKPENTSKRASNSVTIDGIRGDGLCSIWAVLVGTSFYKDDVMKNSSTLVDVENRIKATLNSTDFQKNTGLNLLTVQQKQKQKQDHERSLSYDEYFRYIMALSKLLEIKVRFFINSAEIKRVEDLTYPPYRSRFDIPRIDILLIHGDNGHFHFLSNTKLTLKCRKWWILQWRKNTSTLLRKQRTSDHALQKENPTLLRKQRTSDHALQKENLMPKFVKLESRPFAKKTAATDVSKYDPSLDKVLDEYYSNWSSE